MNQSLEESTFKNSKWMWLPKRHIHHLIGFYSIVYLILIVFSLPCFSFDSIFWIVALSVQFIAFWQTNIVSNSINRRAFHLHSRGIYALCISIALALRRYFLFDSLELLDFIYLFIFLYLISGIASLLIYFLPYTIFKSNKYYIITFTKYVLPFVLLFTFFLVVREEGWFNPNNGKIIRWSDSMEMTFEDFGGYSDLFSDYDASINTQFEFEFDLENNLVKLDAICNQDQTWVNPWDKDDSYFLLKHEIYHFNITEMVTRMARKKVFEAINNGANKSEVEKIISNHQKILRKTQLNYDLETNHSLIVDKQSEWQFQIDSAIAELDSYWTSDIFKNNDQKNNKIVYYRNYNVNDKQKIQGANILMPYEEKYTKHYKFVYDKKNQLNQIVYYSFGKIATDDDLGVSIIKINNNKNGESVFKYYDNANNPILCNKGYHIKITSYLKGNSFAIKYYDLDGNSTKNNLSEHESRIRLDSLGRVISQQYFDENGIQIINEKGFCNRKYYYKDSSSYSYMDENYDFNNHPLVDCDGAFQRFYTYNKDGNLTSFWSKNKRGKYIYSDGYAKVYYKYNNLGMYVSATLVDEKNKLKEDDSGIAKYEFSKDRYGNIVRRTYYNSNNVLTENNNGYAIIITKYDKNNNLLLEAYYDTGGILMFNDDSYGKTAYKYDDLNRRKVIINYNGYDFPFRTETAGPIEIVQYDSLDRVIKGVYFDAYYNVDTSSLGVAYYTRVSDEKDKTLELKQYGIKNKLINTHNDVSIFRYKYDEQGNKIKASYYTKNDKPAYANQGAFINRYKYSEENNMIERSYYDTLNNLIEFDGYAKIKWKYDDRSNVIEKQYFDKNDKIVKEGVAIELYKYNSNNKVIEDFFYNSQGGLVSRKKYNYDENGNKVLISNYTIDGQPIIDGKNVYQYHYSYNDDRMTRESYYGIKGNLIDLNNGVAIIEIYRDLRGNVLVQKTYNKFNQLVKDNELGYAVVKFKYDVYDRVIREDYFDAEENPINSKKMYSTVIFKRDNSGEIIKQCFYDKFRNLTEDKDGVAFYFYKYNRNGVLIESKEYGSEKAKKILINL